LNAIGYCYRPIQDACSKGYIEIVKLLLDRVNLEKTGRDGWNLMHIACYTEQLEIVKFLLDKVDIEAVNIKGLRPIHFACQKKNLDIIKLLVDGFISNKIYGTLPKVNLNRKNNAGYSPLDLINHEPIKEFIDKKLDIIKRTIFIKINSNYYDVCFYLFERFNIN
jgi:ankyrin repeat protein